MNSLPYELFCSILSLLDHKSRSQASLVCRNWNQRLQHSGLLLQTIHCTDLNKHKTMKRFFENASTSLRNKVDTLYYSWNMPFSMNELLELNELFPNIEEIQLLISPNHFESERHSSNSNYSRMVTTSSKIPFWTHLKRVRESSAHMYSLSILKHYQLDHLVRLELDFKNIANHQITETTNVYFSYFKNAPHLENLTLWRVHLTYGDLDILHENSPSIIELTLFYVSFHRHPAGPHTRFYEPLPPINYTPRPADAVKVIRMYDVTFLGAIPLLSYVASKYKRLSTLIITTSDVHAKSQHQPHALELCLNDMTHFMCDLVDMTPELLQRFSMHVLILTSFEISESDSCVELLSVLASTRFRHDLKNLVIRNNLYRYDTCLDYISQLENLDSLVIEARRQYECQEDKDLGYYPYEEEEEEKEEVYEQDNAEELFISLNILDRLSKLKHLSLTSFHIYIDEPIKENNSLEILEVMDCTVQKRNVFDTLSSCLHLKKLTLFCYVNNMSFKTAAVSKKKRKTQKKKDQKIRLKLLHHPFLEKIDVWIKGYPLMRYRDPERKKSWYEVERNGGYVTYYPSRQKGETYFTLECQSADLFFIPQRYNAIYH